MTRPVITVAVNGQDTPVLLDRRHRASSIIYAACQGVGIDARKVTDWELRDPAGRHIDWFARVKDLRLFGGETLFFGPRPGVGA